MIPSVGPLRGGPSVMVQTLAAGLAKAGCSVDVVTTDDNGRGRLATALGEPIERDLVTYRYFRRQTRFYTFSWPLTRWLDRHVGDYDVVHIHALFSYPAVAAARAAHRHDVPYIVRPLGTLGRWAVANRHPILKKLSLRLIESRILDTAAAVHFTTEQEMNDAAAIMALRNGVVIPNPVEAIGVLHPRLGESFRARFPELRGRKVVLFMSRLDAKKGLDLLIAAFARLKRQHPQAVLVIAGSGSNSLGNRLRSEAERLEVTADVLWVGFLEGDDKLAAMAAADVFVLPSYEENFGIAAVEAMGCGVPVVISDRVGIHKEVAHAGGGIVVPCEPDALATGLAAVLADDDLRIGMGRDALGLARDRFSPESVADRILDLYRDVLSADADDEERLGNGPESADVLP